MLEEIEDVNTVSVEVCNSEVDFEGVSKFMRFSGPEHNGKPIKSTALSNSAEATVVMSKLVESFILDAGLRAWMAKEIEPETDLKKATELQTVDLLRAIKTREDFDFLCDTAMPTRKSDTSTSTSKSPTPKKKKRPRAP
tara:strand:+ start:527 stop:943 length:417 start_codon:yes stop_codon:yes gene_type:complete